MRHRIIKKKRSGTYKFRSEPYYYSWLSPESYTIARRVMGLPGLSRKQVDELIEQKSVTEPMEIQLELEPVVDGTSHLLLASSPEAPILLKVPSFINDSGSDKLK
jgi:hypothetical protein